MSCLSGFEFTQLLETHFVTIHNLEKAKTPIGLKGATQPEFICSNLTIETLEQHTSHFEHTSHFKHVITG